jgi:hypothetical protein
VMPGETILSGAAQVCGPGNSTEQGSWLDDFEMHPRDADDRPVTVDVLWDVYKSAAGYYIGTMCPHCGPHTRESLYFATKEEAEKIYTVWLQFIRDGKYDEELLEAADQMWLPGERY